MACRNNNKRKRYLKDIDNPYDTKDQQSERMGPHCDLTYSSIDVLEAGSDTLADVLDLTLVVWVVHGQRVENENLTPLCALVQGSQQLGD